MKKVGQVIKRFNKQVIKTNESHRALGIQKKQRQMSKERRA